MKFIWLTRCEDEKYILMAVEHIVLISPRDDGGSSITPSTGFGYVEVVESPADIARFIQATALET